jgi:hypothetical protein
MANEVTTSADVIDPEVWADAIAPTILGRAQMANPAAGIVTIDDTLVGSPGSTVGFPKWAYLGDAEDLTEGVAIEADKLTLTESFATIKEIGKAVDLTDTARLIALNDPNAEATRQIPVTISRKVDTDLIGSALKVVTGSVDPKNPNTSPLIVPEIAPAMSWDAYVDAIGLFGDDYDPADIGGVFMAMPQYKQLLKDDDFKTVDKFGAGATILRGQVGAIGTVPVFLTNRMPALADADPVEAGNQPGHQVLIVKKGAIALKYKRRPLVETDRDIKRRITTIVATTHYATKRTDDRGVIALGVAD